MVNDIYILGISFKIIITIFVTWFLWISQTSCVKWNQEAALPNLTSSIGTFMEFLKASHVCISL